MKGIAKTLLTLATAMILLAALAGCGSSGGDNESLAEKGAAVSEKDEELIVDAEGKTPQEKTAAREALRYAEDANAGSVFKAVEVMVADGWARVKVEESDVPLEEAVGFDVFLRKQDGAWEVADTGSSVSPDQLPGAPGELFSD